MINEIDAFGDLLRPADGRQKSRRTTLLCVLNVFLGVGRYCDGFLVPQKVPSCRFTRQLEVAHWGASHHTRNGRLSSWSTLNMINSVPSEEEIEEQLAKARELIARAESISKEKKGGKKEKQSAEEKRKKVTKFTKDDGSGLSTFDGELMAKLSQEEEWEVRKIMEVFQDDMDAAIDALNEIEEEAVKALKEIEIDKREKKDNLKKKFFFASTPTTKKLANRDEAKAVSQMRLKMNPNDFDKIFDKRNRRIGDM